MDHGRKGSQAVSVLIKEEQNVNKAAVISPASPAVTAVRRLTQVYYLTEKKPSYKDYRVSNV